MNINLSEYKEKLELFQKGLLSEEAWIEYCKELFIEVLEDARDVMVRLKERD